MGVYIEGMEMPKNGSCIQIVIDDDGEVYPSVEKCILKMGSIAKAVPVPPHGRLIDADAMIHDIEKAITPSRYIKERNADMVKFLSLEDTIIPAEEGE